MDETAAPTPAATPGSTPIGTPAASALDQLLAAHGHCLLVEQADWVIGQVLAQRETGVPMKRQAVLFRSSHHADLLEVELTRRPAQLEQNISGAGRVSQPGLPG